MAWRRRITLTIEEEDCEDDALRERRRTVYVNSAEGTQVELPSLLAEYFKAKSGDDCSGPMDDVAQLVCSLWDMSVDSEAAFHGKEWNAFRAAARAYRDACDAGSKAMRQKHNGNI